LLPAPGQHRQRAQRLSISEVMTLVVAFQDSDYCTFKHFYQKQVCRHWQSEFPGLVSYSRLIECLPAVLVPLSACLQPVWAPLAGLPLSTACLCRSATIGAFIVIRSFAGSAQCGKSSLGWFYDTGDLLALRLTPGNVDDWAPVPDLASGLWGKLFGDRGYLSQELFEQLPKTSPKRCVISTGKH
jgi:Transposase DDE domain